MFPVHYRIRIRNVVRWGAIGVIVLSLMSETMYAQTSVPETMPSMKKTPTRRDPKASANTMPPAASPKERSFPAMFRGDATRRGKALHPIPTAMPRIKWQFRTEQVLHSTPVVDARGHVYIGSRQGTLFSFTPHGTVKWTTRLPGAIYASPALVEHGVAIGTDDDTLYFLSQEDGRILWQFALGPCPKLPGFGAHQVKCDADSSVAIDKQGQLYFGGDRVYALAPTGKLLWDFDLVAHAFSSPALDPEQTLVVIGTQDQFVYALSMKGSLQWSFKTKADFDSTPVVTHDAVYIGCDDYRLYALERLTGKRLWDVATRGPIRSSPAVDDQGTVYVGSYDGKLYAVRPDGNVKWKFSTKNAIHGSPIVDAQGTVLFGSRDNYLYAVTAEGALLWRVDLASDIDSSPVIDRQGTIYVGTDDGTLYALGAE